MTAPGMQWAGFCKSGSTLQGVFKSMTVGDGLPSSQTFCLLMSPWTQIESIIWWGRFVLSQATPGFDGATGVPKRIRISKDTLLLSG